MNDMKKLYEVPVSYRAYGTMYVNEESADHARDACIALIENGTADVMQTPMEQLPDVYQMDIKTGDIREVPASEIRVDSMSREIEANAGTNNDALAELDNDL